MNKQSGSKKVWRDANFLWLVSGNFLTMLGDQFTLIALPWLVLNMTGDTLILGLVLALIGVPRAVFILIGGAVVDRYSPKRVLMLTRYANAALLTCLALLIYYGHLQLWSLYGLALGLGLATAFSIPSGSSILPRMIAVEQLQSANSIVLSLRQISMSVGPLLAGILIVLCGANAHNSISDAGGLAAAILLNAVTYMISIFCLCQVKLSALREKAVERVSILKSVVDGLLHTWRDHNLRSCFLYWGAIAFFISGPIQVALPLLAQQIGGDAVSFGSMMAVHGASTLIGMIFAGARPTLRFGNLGSTILLFDCLVGVLIIPMGVINAVWQGMVLLAMIGGLGGFLMVAIFTWMQKRVPVTMLGRTMSLFMFIFVGVAPVSAAITGWLMHSINTTQLFVGSGALLVLIVILALMFSSIREISDGHMRVE